MTKEILFGYCFMIIMYIKMYNKENTLAILSGAIAFVFFVVDIVNKIKRNGK